MPVSQVSEQAELIFLTLFTVINLCMALGFLAHGYATGEFEVRSYSPHDRQKRDSN